MKKKLNGINITYRISKGTKDAVLLLHGWGGNLNSFLALENSLKSQNYKVITIDFPGFGGSEMPDESWNLDDYYKVAKELLDVEKIEKVNVVAHSFGGRVAILLASREPQRVKKLVLVDSAGIKPKFSLKKTMNIWHYKICKKLKAVGLIKRELVNFGSSDYKAMPQKLKPVFNRIVNSDLSCETKKILCPTIIIWGDSDEDTPFYMAKKINKNIKNSAIIKLNGGHFCYLQNAHKFELIVLDFFK